jgi:NAD(P)H-dependent FMN reductase
MTRKPKILVFAGSLRSGSINQRLADAYASELVNQECHVTRLLLSDYTLPLVDEDLKREKGVPENASRLARQFNAHDAMVVVGPEYNGSITPLLKNTLDWVSLVPTDSATPLKPYRDKLCAIAAASEGLMGGYSSLGHLRDVLVRLGMQVISEQLALGDASNAFDENETLVGQRPRRILENACRSLVSKATLLRAN